MRMTSGTHVQEKYLGVEILSCRYTRVQMFKIMPDCFPHGCIKLHCHQQCTSVLLALHTYQIQTMSFFYLRIREDDEIGGLTLISHHKVGKYIRIELRKI